MFVRKLSKAITFIALLLSVYSAHTQIVVQPVVPRLGIIQKSQLWNLIIINSQNIEVNVNVDLVLQDRLTGHTLMTAQSGIIRLVKGPKQLNEQAAFPVQYKYESLFANFNQQALLPVGSYLACYTVSQTKSQETLAQECVAMDVTPLAPPMLIYPANTTQLVEKSPQLSWTPPTPTNLFNQLRYDVVVTELYKGQSPEEAIQRNNPLYTVGDIPSQSISYPASATSLDTGKVYAWQVVAKNAETYAAKSDVWTFSIRSQTKVEEIISMTPFVKMVKEDAATTIAPNGILKFSYTHLLDSREVTVTISDLTLNDLKQYSSFSLSVNKGENYLQQALKSHIKIEPGHLYMATLTNSIKENYYLRFEVKDYKD